MFYQCTRCFHIWNEAQLRDVGNEYHCPRCGHFNFAILRNDGSLDTEKDEVKQFDEGKYA